MYINVIIYIWVTLYGNLLTISSSQEKKNGSSMKPNFGTISMLSYFYLYMYTFKWLGYM